MLSPLSGIITPWYDRIVTDNTGRVHLHDLNLDCASPYSFTNPVHTYNGRRLMRSRLLFNTYLATHLLKSVTCYYYKWSHSRERRLVDMVLAEAISYFNERLTRSCTMPSEICKAISCTDAHWHSPRVNPESVITSPYFSNLLWAVGV